MAKHVQVLGLNCVVIIIICFQDRLESCHVDDFHCSHIHVLLVTLMFLKAITIKRVIRIP